MLPRYSHYSLFISFCQCCGWSLSFVMKCAYVSMNIFMRLSSFVLMVGPKLVMWHREGRPLREFFIKNTSKLSVIQQSLLGEWSGFNWHGQKRDICRRNRWEINEALFQWRCSRCNFIIEPLPFRQKIGQSIQRSFRKSLV